ncbi:MAG TPA: lysylphosphatidylglycerol synthase transmembrane domain-containing protein [Syntrophorhabdaceae bacterium]
MKVFNLIILAAGVPLLALLVYSVGPQALWHEFTLLGWKLVPLVLLEGASNLFNTQGWRHCLSDSHKLIPFGRVLCLMMAGSSINYLTPTAGLGGEVAKGLLLAAGREGPLAASAVLLDKLTSALAQLIFINCGYIIFLNQVEMPAALHYSLISATGVLGAGIVGFLVVQRYGKLGALVRWAVHHRLGGAALRRVSDSMTEVDYELRRFHRTRSRDLALSVFWHLMGVTWGIIPLFYFLILTRDLASLQISGALAVLGKWFDLVSFAIPTDIGIQEATRVLAFKIIGFPSAVGLTYALTRRLQQVFWAGIGLALYGLVVSTPHFPVPRPDAEGKERIR